MYGVNAVFILRKDCISWKKRLADAKNAVGPCQEELKIRVSGHTIDKRVGPRQVFEVMRQGAEVSSA